MTDRLDRLIAAAAACQTCGHEHEYRRIDDGQTMALLHGQLQPVRKYTWASPTDGHEYRPPQDLTVEWMKQWAAANPEPATAEEPTGDSVSR